MRGISHYSEELAAKVVASCLMSNYYRLFLRKMSPQSAGLLVHPVESGVGEPGGNTRRADLLELPGMRRAQRRLAI